MVPEPVVHPSANRASAVVNGHHFERKVAAAGRPMNPASVLSQMIYTDSALSPVSAGNNGSFNQQVVFQLLRSMLQVMYACLYVVQSVTFLMRRAKLRLLMVMYHHNRTPQLIRNDVIQLSKIPKHVAVILDLKEHEEGGDMEGLLDQAGEISAWCIGAGISTLTIYERTGILRDAAVRDTYQAIASKLEAYFGVTDRPSLQVCVPHSDVKYTEDFAVATSDERRFSLEVNLLSLDDGRETIVDLSRTLAELTQQFKIKSKDVTQDVIDREMKALVIDEPDLLVLFGPVVDLQGFPPWQIRLSEIYHQPDNDEVSYTVFLKALQMYAGAKFNLGS